MISEEKRFSRLRIENLRCFEKVEIPLDPHLTVIIGENGAGKTTIVLTLLWRRRRPAILSPAAREVVRFYRIV